MTVVLSDANERWHYALYLVNKNIPGWGGLLHICALPIWTITSCYNRP